MENVRKDNEKQNDLEVHKPRVSIQEAFKKFQKEKFYQLKLNKYLKNIDKDRTSAEFKQQLREKFIQTAKKYIGVPYGQKYHQPGDPLYSAPLFIDCCALVKQCVFDLRQEFGFTLGKWNQSYQLDMLPDQNLKEEDLKPGDLIFYSGTYYNPKLKPFPHRMVHVEIYLGEGKSIGARWQKQTINIFDSYKFVSKQYYDIQFHYRSIDSWLEGKVQNHCKQHKWLDDRENNWLSDKYSVFADPSLDDMDLAKNEQIQTRSIMVGKGNNSKLIKEYFASQQNYSLMPEKEQFSPNFYYKWVQSTGEVDFYSFKEGKQIVNHIPNIRIISSKLDLLNTLQEFELDCQNNKKASTMKIDSFVPKTYRLNIMSDEIQFLNDKASGIWIYKPSNLNQGKGIKLISDIQEFKNEFIKSKKFYLGEYSLNNMLHYKPQLNPSLSANSREDANGSTNSNKYAELSHDGLIQHYIQPLLLEGKKFDIRCYMLLNSQPSLVLFHEGYLRLTLEDYTEEDMENPDKLMVHLTNNCFQHKHKDYKAKKQSTIANWTTLIKEIGQKKAKYLRHQIKRILLLTYAAAKRKLMQKKGTYQLLGFDILVDKECKPYLLQVNTNPALFTDTTVQKQIIPAVVRSSLNVVLGIFESPKDQPKYIQQAGKSGFELLYSEQSNYIYNLENEEADVVEVLGASNELTFEVNGLRATVECQFKDRKLIKGDRIRVGDIEK